MTARPLRGAREPRGMATKIKVACYITPRKHYKVRVGVRWATKVQYCHCWLRYHGTQSGRAERYRRLMTIQDPGTLWALCRISDSCQLVLLPFRYSDFPPPPPPPAKKKNALLMVGAIDRGGDL